MRGRAHVHGSCVARQGAGVLLTGPSGSGKSDLVLRLLARGFELVADDQVEVADGWASAPAALAGMLEVRGIGLVRVHYLERARLKLVIALGECAERLPQPGFSQEYGLPLIRLDARANSAPERISLALDCLQGRAVPVAGAFAA